MINAKYDISLADSTYTRARVLDTADFYYISADENKSYEMWAIEMPNNKQTCLYNKPC